MIAVWHWWFPGLGCWVFVNSEAHTGRITLRDIPIQKGKQAP
jgi:hypothetical protein